jgi:hypothetical protein
MLKPWFIQMDRCLISKNTIHMCLWIKAEMLDFLIIRENQKDEVWFIQVEDVWCYE